MRRLPSRQPKPRDRRSVDARESQLRHLPQPARPGRERLHHLPQLPRAGKARESGSAGGDAVVQRDAVRSKPLILSLGSARASRAGFGAVAETIFSCLKAKFAMARAPSPAREARALPEKVVRL